MHKDLQDFRVVGRGANCGEDGESIVVEAGWDESAKLEAAVVLQVSRPIRNVRIQAEFRGYVETRWEGLNKLAMRMEAPDYKISRVGKVFQQIVEIVYESRHAPITPSSSGAAVRFPFTFNLPKNKMPPSFDSVGGSVDYYIKCSLTFQESKLGLLKNVEEIAVPVRVLIPEKAKMRLMKHPSMFTHTIPGSDEKVGYSLKIPKKIVQIGDSLEVQLTIHSTPGRLRSVHMSLRPIVAYLNNDSIAQRATFPRPLSEITQQFPLLHLTSSDQPISRKLFLLVDPAIAPFSFESPLISVRTVLRLQIITDDSETPNISAEFPIVVISPLKEPIAAEESNSPTTLLNLPVPENLTTPTMIPSMSPSLVGLVFERSNSIASFSALPEPGMLLPISSFNNQEHVGSNTNNAFPTLRSGQIPASPALGPQVPSIQTLSLEDDGVIGLNASLRPVQSMDAGSRDFSKTTGQIQTTGSSNNSAASPISSAEAQSSSSGTAAHSSGIFRSPDTMPQMLSSGVTVGGAAGIWNDASIRLPTPPPGYQDPIGELMDDYGVTEGSHAVQEEDKVSRSKSGTSGGSLSRDTGYNPTIPVEEWDKFMVAQWVRALGATDEDVQTFIRHDIDGVVLLSLSADDLKSDLGISLLGTRRRISLGIEKLKSGK